MVARSEGSEQNLLQEASSLNAIFLGCFLLSYKRIFCTQVLSKIPILCPFQCISQSHIRIFHFSLVVELSMTLWNVLYLSNNVTYESLTWLRYIQTLDVNLNLQDHLKEGHGGEFCFHI